MASPSLVHRDDGSVDLSAADVAAAVQRPESVESAERPDAAALRARPRKVTSAPFAQMTSNRSGEYQGVAQAPRLGA